MSNDRNDDERLGLSADITRRDILNSTVLGEHATRAAEQVLALG